MYHNLISTNLEKDQKNTFQASIENLFKPWLELLHSYKLSIGCRCMNGLIHQNNNFCLQSASLQLEFVIMHLPCLHNYPLFQ